MIRNRESQTTGEEVLCHRVCVTGTGLLVARDLEQRTAPPSSRGGRARPPSHGHVSGTCEATRLEPLGKQASQAASCMRWLPMTAAVQPSPEVWLVHHRERNTAGLPRAPAAAMVDGTDDLRRTPVEQPPLKADAYVPMCMTTGRWDPTRKINPKYSRLTPFAPQLRREAVQEVVTTTKCQGKYAISAIKGEVPDWARRPMAHQYHISCGGPPHHSHIT